jgi:hypothetical protein
MDAERIREIVTELTQLRLRGLTLAEAAERIGLSESDLNIARCQRNIAHACPDLAAAFAASGAPGVKTAARRAATKVVAETLNRRHSVDEAYAEAVEIIGVASAEYVLRRAREIAFAKKSGAYYQYAEAVLSGEVAEVEYAAPAASVKMHRLKTKVKKPKFCDRCGAHEKLYRLWVGGSPARGCKGVLQFLCRECFCADEVAPIEQIEALHKNNSVAANAALMG